MGDKIKPIVRYWQPPASGWASYFADHPEVKVDLTGPDEQILDFRPIGELPLYQWDPSPPDRVRTPEPDGSDPDVYSSWGYFRFGYEWYLRREIMLGEYYRFETSEYGFEESASNDHLFAKRQKALRVLERNIEWRPSPPREDWDESQRFCRNAAEAEEYERRHGILDPRPWESETWARFCSRMERDTRRDAWLWLRHESVRERYDAFFAQNDIEKTRSQRENELVENHKRAEKSDLDGFTEGSPAYNLLRASQSRRWADQRCMWHGWSEQQIATMDMYLEQWDEVPFQDADFLTLWCMRHGMSRAGVDVIREGIRAQGRDPEGILKHDFDTALAPTVSDLMRLRVDDPQAWSDALRAVEVNKRRHETCMREKSHLTYCRGQLQGLGHAAYRLPGWGGRRGPRPGPFPEYEIIDCLESMIFPVELPTMEEDLALGLAKRLLRLDEKLISRIPGVAGNMGSATAPDIEEATTSEVMQRLQVMEQRLLSSRGDILSLVASAPASDIVESTLNDLRERAEIEREATNALHASGLRLGMEWLWAVEKALARDGYRIEDAPPANSEATLHGNRIEDAPPANPEATLHELRNRLQALEESLSPLDESIARRFPYLREFMDSSTCPPNLYRYGSLHELMDRLQVLVNGLRASGPPEPGGLAHPRFR